MRFLKLLLLTLLFLSISFTGCVRKTPCLQCAQEKTTDKEARWKALNYKVVELIQKGQYKDATKQAKEAVIMAEKTLGKEHPFTATSLNNLAEIYRIQKKYREAESNYNKS